jgi:hypothetical protein
MSATVINPALPLGSLAPSRTQWIISRHDDMVWFIGSAAVGYLALALMALGFPVTLIYFIWLIGVDGPHVIATVSRTYFDKHERARLGWWLWVVLPLMAIGPVMVWLKQGALFYLFAVCWQHYHIAKQHFGFMMLWKAKNRERDPADQKLDRWFLLASTILPLALFVAWTRLPDSRVLNAASTASIAGYGALAAAYIAYQVKKYRAGTPMNAPKLLLLLVLVPLQWLAFTYAARLGPGGIVRAGITLGLFHSFQYHRLLWFHNKNRYGAPEAKAKHGGLAPFLAKNFGYYIAAAIGLHFLTTFLPQAMFPAVEWLQAALWGFAFTHYVLDSRIWRVRGDKELAAALRM